MPVAMEVLTVQAMVLQQIVVDDVMQTSIWNNM